MSFFDAPLLGGANETALLRAAGEQITPLYGTLCRSTPVFFLQDGFPADFLNPADLNLQTAHLRAANPNMPNAMTQQWSFGIQRELPWGIVGEADYTGSAGRHLYDEYDTNRFVGDP